MSVKTVCLCDTCGKELPYTTSTPRAVLFGVDMDDVHGCSKEHLRLALAKAFGIQFDGRAQVRIDKRDRRGDLTGPKKPTKPSEEQ